ncbi:porin [Caballeronia sp. LjRoot34]|uniref:porin n=1 Tax=Caballeronia sp. LjRoot34 TaxID=3342325 RepID=UPI003ED08B2A
MKKQLTLATALVALGALPAVADAQSSVTLYGVIDTGFQYQNGMPQGHLVSMESGNLLPSRWGLKGAEDIGGGTQVIFRLESGFNSTTGALSCGIFCRQAIVGVTNPAYGTVKVGRIGVYEIQEDSYDLDPQLMNLYGLSTLVRGRNWTLASNTVEYTSPKLLGFTFKGEYDLTNNTGWNSGNPGSGPGQLYGAQGRSDGVSVAYEAGPVNLLAIYDEIRDSNGTFDNVYQNSRSITGGGTVNVGPVKLYAGYQHLSAPQASVDGYFVNTGAPATTLPSGATLPTAVDHEWFGARWDVTPAAALLAGWYHTNANHGNGNANLWTLGGTYSLSRRTFFYSEFGAVTNSKTSNIGLGDGYSDPYGANSNNDPASGAANFRTNPNFGGSQVGVFAGMVTHF